VGVQDLRVDCPRPSVDGVLQGLARFATAVRPPVQA
jgi:hypothetical protein